MSGGNLDLFLILPLASWAVLGFLTGWAAWRSARPRWLLRLSALFLGLWGLLMTTLVVWVLFGGGERAAWALLAAPQEVLEPSALHLWLLGMVGTFLVFAVAFTLNQLVARGFLYLLEPETLPWPPRLPVVDGVWLFRFPSDALDAFSFTLLDMERSGRIPRPRRRDVVLVSDAVLRTFSPEEVEAVIAHELGHVLALDGRYLTYVRTLSSLIRADPFLAWFARTLTRREEMAADDEAVRVTGNPLALARALFKSSTMLGKEGEEGPASRTSLLRPVPSYGLLGARAGGPADVQQRIQRLLGRVDENPPAGSP